MFFLGFVALTYVTIRAAKLSFVHDESITYLLFVYPQTPLSKVITYSTPIPSNNHLLNSLLERLSSIIFGISEFALRLPNVIAYIVYLVSAFLIVRRFRSGLVAVSSFILLNASPFMLDFFGLARGYGLGLGFLMLSVLTLTKYFEKDKTSFKDKFMSFFFAALAVFAHFTFLHFYLALFATFTVVQAWLIFFKPRWPENYKKHKTSGQSKIVRQKVGQFIKEIWPSFLVTAVLLATALPMILKLKAMNELYVGGKTGFFLDTVVTSVRYFLYSDQPLLPWEKILSYVVVALFLSSFAFLLWHLYREKFKPSSKILTAPFLAVVITLFATASTILQHYLLGINFLTDRGALLFTPLFILSLAFLFEEIFYLFEPKKFLRLMGTILLVALSVGAVINFGSHANFSYALTWNYDAKTRDFIDDLIKFHDYQITHNLIPYNRRMSLGINWVFEPTINFYILTKNLGWLNFVDRGGLVNRKFDYYFYTKEDRSLLAKSFVNIKELKVYPVTGYVSENIFGIPMEQ